jgi:hypothetical protein
MGVGQLCSVARLYESLEFDEGKELLEIINGPDSSASIARALQSLGYQMKDGAISRHRRHECNCPT